MNDTTVNNTRAGGLGLAGVLTVIFVLCKVFAVGEIAHWSWWWVFSPIWIAWGIFFGVLLIGVVFALLIAVAGAVMAAFGK